MSSGESESSLQNRRPSSPVQGDDQTLNFPRTACTPAQTNATSLLAVAKRVDSDASIAAVTKAGDDTTLIKIDPGAEAGTAKTLATLAALRVAFPFATVSALECHSTGNTQFQVILRTNSEELRHAKEVCANFRSMKILNSLSNTLGVCGLCTYAALLYATAIRP